MPSQPPTSLHGGHDWQADYPQPWWGRHTGAPPFYAPPLSLSKVATHPCQPPPGRSPLLAGAGDGPQLCPHPDPGTQKGGPGWLGTVAEGAGGGWAGSFSTIRQMVPLAWGRGLAFPVSLEPPVPSSEASSSVTSKGSGHITLVTKAALPERGDHSGQLQVTRSLSPHRGPGAWS